MVSVTAASPDTQRTKVAAPLRAFEVPPGIVEALRQFGVAAAGALAGSEAGQGLLTRGAVVATALETLQAGLPEVKRFVASPDGHAAVDTLVTHVKEGCADGLEGVMGAPAATIRATPNQEFVAMVARFMPPAVATEMNKVYPFRESPPPAAPAEAPASPGADGTHAASAVAGSPPPPPVWRNLFGGAAPVLAAAAAAVVASRLSPTPAPPASPPAAVPGVGAENLYPQQGGAGTAGELPTQPAGVTPPAGGDGPATAGRKGHGRRAGRNPPRTQSDLKRRWTQAEPIITGLDDAAGASAFAGLARRRAF